MPKISACIISFNEEKKIEACLQSLLPVADEIVIIDSQSTDRTLELAGKYTSNIFTQAFLGYGKQKNLALEKASHDWILSIDCDERLSPELQQGILAIKDELGRNDAYSMARKTFYVYRWLNHCWYPDIKTRLFNRKKAKWAENAVHESVDCENAKVARIRGDILHYSFDSISDHLQTIDRFTEIGADELIRDNKRINVLSPLTHASWIFIKLYVLKRGFLDGFAGLTVSVLSYMHVYTKYSKALIKRRQANDGQNGQ